MDTPRELIKIIGQQLDEDIFPRIMNGGIVTPGGTATTKTPRAEENAYERSGTHRPELRPWTRPTRRQGQTNRCRTPSNTSPLISTNIESQYESELTAVHEAYPGTRTWHQSEGLWLLTESSLLPGLWQKAVFLTGVPFSRTRAVRSWGFWMGIPFNYPVWIGPRHTNSPDGSVCAFEVRDGTWKLGDSLVVLLDLFTLWAFRHLHLQFFRRWPGRQAAHFAYERLTELAPEELCICDSGKHYGNCCKQIDLKRDRFLEASRYFDASGGIRTLPVVVANFTKTQNTPPQIVDVLFEHSYPLI